MKRVLVAPLDWGLGHATRCIPVIQKLQSRGCEVMIAGSGASLALLKAEFPLMRWFEIAGYRPVYPSRGSMVLKMIRQIPRFLKTIFTEHRQIQTLIAANNIGLVIADNRYGCWSSRVPCVFITHQSNIMMPKRFGWLSGFVRMLNEHYMKKFTWCWIPDFNEPRNLAGELATFGKVKAGLRVDFIGPLSRFKPAGANEKKVYDVLAIFSGPEPQRTIFEDIVTEQLKTSGMKYFVVRGVVSSSDKRGENVADFLTAAELQKKIESSEMVVARSGYSTVMDMAALGKKVIFVPTPGQTEQVYLAKRLKEMNIAFSMEQKNFNLAVAVKASRSYSGFQIMHAHDHSLDAAIDSILNSKTVFA